MPRAKRGCNWRISQAACGVSLRALLACSMVFVLSLRGDVMLLADPAGDDRLAVKCSSSDVVLLDEVEELGEESE